MYCRLFSEAINADRFLKAIQKSELFEKNTILKEFKPKGRTMQMNFISISQISKIEMS
jgi:hypothetical protein